MAPPRRAYDKTSYAIAPTPASPARITSPSPSLSPSNSNSASSSTEPTTPPSRPRKNYPDAIGRVPLHRRGTSKTYERLEDLLREAGYKETRIFTPETDRAATQPDGAKSPTISAQVVGFLSHLVPSRSTSLQREDNHEPESTRAYSPPPSPSLNRTPRPLALHATRSSTSRPAGRRDSNANSVVSSKRDMQPSIQRHQSRDSVASIPIHQPVPERPVNRYYQHHPSTSRSSAMSSGGLMSPTPVYQHPPTPTRASTYLRHMTSYERPQSTPPTTSVYARLTDDAEDESILSPTLPPRMPTGWLENVKRAKEYFAATPATTLPPISGSPVAVKSPILGRSVSVKTRGRLSDRTNAVAPVLTARLRTGRAKRSESQVSVSRVVCRSRGSSPVRRDGKGKAREADLELRGHLELPDDEDFARSRFLGGWGTSAQLLSPPRRRDVDTDSASDVSSEGEEEITLARILVPSRQHGLNPPAIERSRSERSLRRCLELDQAHEVIPPVPPLPNYGATGSGRWSLSLSWGRARGEDETQRSSGADEHENPEVWGAGSGKVTGKGSVRQRSGLPSWTS